MDEQNAQTLITAIKEMPNFISQPEPALFQSQLLNLNEVSQNVIQEKFEIVQSRISNFTSRVFSHLKYEIDNRQMYVLFEKELNCDVETDHLMPKSVLPIFQGMLDEAQRKMTVLDISYIKLEIIDAIEEIIHSEVEMKLQLEQNTYFQNSKIEALEKLTGFLEQLIMNVAKEKSLMTTDKIQLLMEVIEQTKKKLKIGGLYKPDHRGVTLDQIVGNAQASDNDQKLAIDDSKKKLQQRVNEILQLNHRISQLQAELEGYKSKAQKYDQLMSDFKDSQSEIEKLKKLLKNYKQSDKNNKQPNKVINNNVVVSDTESSHINSQISFTQKELLEQNQELKDEVERLKKLLLLNNKQNVEEMERLRQENLQLESNQTSRPVSRNLSRSGSRQQGRDKENKFKKQVELDQKIATKLLQYISGYDFNVDEQVSIQKQIVDLNLNDQIIFKTRYLCQEQPQFTINSTQTSGNNKQILDNQSQLRKSQINDQQPQENDLVINQQQNNITSNIIDNNKEKDDFKEQAVDNNLLISNSNTDNNSSNLLNIQNQQDQDNEQKRLLLSKYDQQVDQINSKYQPVINQLDNANNLISQSRKHLQTIVDKFVDKGVQTGSTDFDNNQLDANLKGQILYQEAQKILKGSKLTENILSEKDKPSDIYAKLHKTTHQYSQKKQQLLSQAQIDKQKAYEKILKSYRIHKDVSRDSISKYNPVQIDISSKNKPEYIEEPVLEMINTIAGSVQSQKHNDISFSQDNSVGEIAKVAIQQSLQQYQNQTQQKPQLEQGRLKTNSPKINHDQILLVKASSGNKVTTNLPDQKSMNNYIFKQKEEALEDFRQAINQQMNPQDAEKLFGSNFLLNKKAISQSGVKSQSGHLKEKPIYVDKIEEYKVPTSQPLPDNTGFNSNFQYYSAQSLSKQQVNRIAQPKDILQPRVSSQESSFCPITLEQAQRAKKQIDLLVKQQLESKNKEKRELVVNAEQQISIQNRKQFPSNNNSFQDTGVPENLVKLPQFQRKAVSSLQQQQTKDLQLQDIQPTSKAQLQGTKRTNQTVKQDQKPLADSQMNNYIDNTGFKGQTINKVPYNQNSGQILDSEIFDAIFSTEQDPNKVTITMEDIDRIQNVQQLSILKK